MIAFFFRGYATVGVSAPWFVRRSMCRSFGLSVGRDYFHSSIAGGQVLQAFSFARSHNSHSNGPACSFLSS